MRELNTCEIEAVNGGSISTGEGATLILAIGAMGGPVTFAFAFPIAVALYAIS